MSAQLQAVGVPAAQGDRAASVYTARSKLVSKWIQPELVSVVHCDGTCNRMKNRTRCIYPCIPCTSMDRKGCITYDLSTMGRGIGLGVPPCYWEQFFVHGHFKGAEGRPRRQILVLSARLSRTRQPNQQRRPASTPARSGGHLDLAAAANCRRYDLRITSATGLCTLCTSSATNTYLLLPRVCDLTRPALGKPCLTSCKAWYRLRSAS